MMDIEPHTNIMYWTFLSIAFERVIHTSVIHATQHATDIRTDIGGGRKCVECFVADKPPDYKIKPPSLAITSHTRVWTTYECTGCIFKL